jgi:transglutaminase-like putative cysteine protease
MHNLAQLIEGGRWQQATEFIERHLARPELGPSDRNTLEFERERMRRIRLDFSWNRSQVFAAAQAILPGLVETDFDRWEREGAVEFWEIDGVRRYFRRAADNLFRIHPEARQLKEAVQPSPGPVSALRRANIRDLLRETAASGQPTGAPKTFRVRYALTVKPGAVPAGELIRAWLPYPRRDGRQHGVRLIASQPDRHRLSEPGHPLSSIYLEQPSRGALPTIFEVQFAYSTAGCSAVMDPAAVTVSTESKWLAERPPHLVFDDALRALSRQIVGTETRPYFVARRLFQWVSENVTWAGAREYSTIESLPAYALRRRQGDCGIQTMLFLALGRLNGIPARWESGFTTEPNWNLHDWCVLHLPPYGWVPVDVSYGLLPSGEDRERWFYFGGLDSYRLVLNRDYGQELQPPKEFVRSERVDFQRGEVEWRGGNLYFDQWNHRFEHDSLSAEPLRW